MNILICVAGAVATWCFLPDNPLAALTRTRQCREIPVTTTQLVIGVLSGLIAYLVLGGIAGLLLGVMVSCGAVVIMKAVPASAKAKHDRALREQLPLTVTLIASSVQAGIPLRQAVRHVRDVSAEPTASVLNMVVANQDIGRDEKQAWELLRDEPAWAHVAGDISRSIQSGAAMSNVLRSHVDEASAELQTRELKRARSVGVKAIGPLVACYLPAFLLVGVVPIIASTITEFLS